MSMPVLLTWDAGKQDDALFFFYTVVVFFNLASPDLFRIMTYMLTLTHTTLRNI